MHGEKEYKGNNHILVMGLTNETEQLIEQIQKDETYAGLDVVLVAALSRHPFSDLDNVFFVKGSPEYSVIIIRARINISRVLTPLEQLSLQAPHKRHLFSLFSTTSGCLRTSDASPSISVSRPLATSAS